MLLCLNIGLSLNDYAALKQTSKRDACVSGDGDLKRTNPIFAYNYYSLKLVKYLLHIHEMRFLITNCLLSRQ